jgi:hypothetical protein
MSKVFVLTAVILVMLSAAGAQPQYTYTFLTFSGANRPQVRGVNSSGQVVGFYFDNFSFTHGFLLKNGTACTPGTPDCVTIDAPGAIDTSLNGVNNSGVAVGFFDVFGSTHDHGFIAGAPPIDCPGATTTSATGISDAGDVVGFCVVPGPLGVLSPVEVFGFVRSAGNLTTNNLCERTFPSQPQTFFEGINNKGQIVGFCTSGDDVPTSFVLTDGIPTILGIIPRGIDDAGEILGTTNGVNTLLLTSGTSCNASSSNCVAIACPEASQTFGRGISSSGQIAGSCFIPSGPNAGLQSFVASSGCKVDLASTLPYFQADPPWKTDIYAHHSSAEIDLSCPISQNKPTIQCKGCALTALSMALFDSGATQFSALVAPNNPRFLNIFMQNEIGDFVGKDGDDVDFFTTTLDVGLATGLTILPTKVFAFDDTTFGPSDKSTDLFEAVCKNPSGRPTPVIVRVNGSSNGKIRGHYVLVTGAQPLGNDSFEFAIVDPGHRANTTLGKYGNHFEMRGFVVDPAGDNSALSLSTGGAADLVLTDSSGRRTGFDNATGIVVREIAHSAYFRDDLGSDEAVDAPAETAHLIHVLQPGQGVYTLSVTGLQLGVFHIIVRAFSQDGSAQPPLTVDGITAPDKESTIQIDFQSTPGAVSTATRIVTFQSAIDDITHSFNLGLIDNQGIADSLAQKMQAAQRGVNANAKGILNAFVNEVNAQLAKHISTEAGNVLLQDANLLIAKL